MQRKEGISVMQGTGMMDLDARTLTIGVDVVPIISVGWQGHDYSEEMLPKEAEAPGEIVHIVFGPYPPEAKEPYHYQCVVM